MLKEYAGVSQHAGESFRRLFWDDYFQLYVWFDSEQRIVGFELSYDLANDCRAFRWKPDRGVEHYRVDDGEGRAIRKGVPILHADDTCVDHRIATEFTERSGGIALEITALVGEKLRDYLHRLPAHVPI